MFLKIKHSEHFLQLAYALGANAIFVLSAFAAEYSPRRSYPDDLPIHENSASVETA